MENQLPARMPEPPEHDVEALMKQLEPKKQFFLRLMKEQFGNIAGCCKAAGISRRTFYNWRDHDPLFREIYESEEYEEDMLDYAESKLKDKITDKDTIAIIFFLKTKGKKRGYVEKTEITGRLSLDKEPTWFDPKQLPPSEHDDIYTEAEVVSTTTNKSTP